MKKMLTLWAALMMVFASVCGALAETDSEITISDHNFGETLQKTLDAGVVIQSLQFYSQPQTSRFVADPVAEQMIWYVSSENAPLTFSARLGQTGFKQVAGHDASTTLYFYYPTLEDAKEMNLKNAVFYAEKNEFFDNGAETFEDLKTRLSSLYGDPVLAETGDEIWGELQMTEYQEYGELLKQLRDNIKTSFAVWNSAENNASIVLVLYSQNGWEYVELDYLDNSADEKILKLN